MEGRLTRLAMGIHNNGTCLRVALRHRAERGRLRPAELAIDVIADAEERKFLSLARRNRLPFVLARSNHLPSRLKSAIDFKTDEKALIGPFDRIVLEPAVGPDARTVEPQCFLLDQVVRQLGDSNLDPNGLYGVAAVEVSVRELSSVTSTERQT